MFCRIQVSIDIHGMDTWVLESIITILKVGAYEDNKCSHGPSLAHNVSTGSTDSCDDHSPGLQVYNENGHTWYLARDPHWFLGL